LREKASRDGVVVSIIIPVRRIGPLLEAALGHLAAQTFREFDVFVVPDDAATLGTDGVRIIASGPVLPNRKRHIAAAAGAAEIVAFIDDDAYPDPGWLAAALPHFDDPAVVAVGGPGVTPPSASPGQRASGAIFASRLVTAQTRERYVAGVRRNVDGLPSCNLLMRRDVFVRCAATSLDRWPGEDILTCLEATRGGGRIVYEPAALVYHHRRELFGPHLTQVWRYGLFRGAFTRRQPFAWTSAVYLVPAAFVIAHVPLAALVARRRTRRAALAAAAGYAALVAIDAVREGRAARANGWAVAAGIYLTHLAYGAGTIAGFVRSSVRARD
jgi:GT2 family glycosyltransferase